MEKIKITGNADIDQATAEIAVALRYAALNPATDQHYYDEAMRLRDAIMAGTRELDDDGALARAEHEREMAREEFKRTGAHHTHVATSGNRVHRPGTLCPGATCYAMAVNEIDDEAAHVIREGRC